MADLRMPDIPSYYTVGHEYSSTPLTPAGTAASAFALFAALLPSIVAMIPIAEAAFSGQPGSGEAKKQLVMQGVKVGTEVAAKFIPELQHSEIRDAVHAAASAVVDSTVAVLRAVHPQPGS